MPRKLMFIAIGSFALLFICLYGVYYFYFTTNETDPLKLIPADAALVIETPNLKNLTKRLNNDNEIWQTIKGFSFMKNNCSSLAVIDSLLGVEPELDKLTSNKKAVLSLLKVNESAEVLLLLPLPNATDEKLANRFFKKYCKSNPSFERIEIDGTKLFCLKYGKKKKKSFYFTLSKGFIVGSSTSELAKECCSFGSSKSLLDDNIFRKVNATKSKNSDAHIFINYKALASLCEPSMRNKMVAEKLEQFVHWSVADLQASTQSISLTGFSLPEPTRDYLSTLVHQSPVRIDPSEGLPANTDAFYSLGLESLPQFFTDYRSVLDMYGQLPPQTVESSKIESVLASIVDSEICLAFIRQSLASNQTRQSIVSLKLRDPKTTASQLARIASIVPADSGEVHGKKFKIYGFEQKSLFFKAFGDLFRESASNYVAITDRYAYFGNSLSSLKSIVLDVKNGNTLSENDSYTNLSASLTSQCNFYAYLNPSSACDMADYVFSKNTAKLFTQNYRTVNKFGGMVLQLSSNKEMVYHNLVLLSKADDRKNTKQVWTSRLEAGLVGKPFVFDLPNNEKAIFVSDAHGNAYLLDADGETIWKKHLGKIMSRVYAIDYYNNGKTQFLFNTKDRIHLIDRKGKEVEAYPIDLKSEASNGLTLADYDGKKDYRIFIACENKKVLCLDKNAKAVEGWNTPLTNSPVHTEITYTAIGDKDYLFFSSRDQIYILDRKGNPRLKINEKMNFSEPHSIFLKQDQQEAYWVSNLRNGRICSVMPSGKIHYRSFKKMPKDYYFSLIEPRNDPENQLFSFAYLDKLEVYDNSHQLQFDYSFKGNISSSPEMMEIDGETKLAVSTASEGKIYLFNLDGSLFRGFPFNGAGQFTLARLGSKESRYNILVGDNAGNLVCYVLD